MKWNTPLLRFFVVACALVAFSNAQETYDYTFTNSVDGTNWPNVLADGDSA
jgi:hypothetical protein